MRIRRPLTVIVGVMLLGCALPAQPSERGKDAADEVARAVRNLQEKAGVPGISVAIGLRGVVARTIVLGFADLEHGVKVTPETRFRTASIAKPMTAVAAMQLVEQKKLDLESDVRKWVPRMPQKRWPVNLEQLLCHQSGVRHYARAEEASGKRSLPSLSASLDLFVDDQLLFEPGTGFSYSTYAFTLVGCAIEKVAGRSFEAQLRERIWKRAGMAHTGVDHHYEVVRSRARGYMRLDERNLALLPESLRARLEVGQITRAPLHDTSMKIPGGGILSTPSDLVRFGLAMLEDRLVEKQTREDMWTARKTRDGKITRSGLGWMVSPAGRLRQVAHSGGQAGATCMLVIRPDAAVVVAIMTNMQRAPGVAALAMQIADIVSR